MANQPPRPTIYVGEVFAASRKLLQQIAPKYWARTGFAAYPLIEKPRSSTESGRQFCGGASCRSGSAEIRSAANARGWGASQFGLQSSYTPLQPLVLLARERGHVADRLEFLAPDQGHALY